MKTLNTLRDGVIGRELMIATGHPLAAAAARNMLAEGGSAIDAAIAADAVMGVVEPMATGIGGDMQAMIVESDGAAITYNGTGRAPAALSPDRVAALPGQRIPQRHALSVTVPGLVRGWHDVHRRYGKVDWSRLFSAAIDAAENGFAVAPVASKEWHWFDRVLHHDAACAALYRAGAPLQAGEKFANPDLAKVLRGIAAHGDEFFYHGQVAQAVERASRESGGVLTADDLANHSGNYAQPLRRQFRGLTMLECPPNTHGCAVLDALGELDALPLEPNDPQAFIHVIRATARAMDHAKKTVADPSGNTVCTVVVDRDGLAVTLMSSIFKRFGSGIAVPGCGFVLQNRGFGFSTPGHINGPAGNKRPYHTVIPAASLREGRFFAGFGVVGGLMQPQGQVQLMVRLAAWNEPLQEAVNAPRWRLEAGNTLAIEAGMPSAITRQLRACGFLEPPAGEGELAGRSDFGGAQIVMRDVEGNLIGASDPRKDGMAWGK